MTNINTPIMGPQHMPTIWALSYSFLIINLIIILINILLNIYNGPTTYAHNMGLIMYELNYKLNKV